MSSPVLEMPITTPASYCSHRPGDNLPVTRVVLHDEEIAPSAHSAHDVARVFARPDYRKGSAHYLVDSRHIEHCVPEDTRAYHAPPNKGSIGIEHDGYARQTRSEWLDGDSLATLHRSATLVGEICYRHGLPARFLTVDELRTNPGALGITTHAVVSVAFRQSDHTDPGAHFPLDLYLHWVEVTLDQLHATRPTHAAPRPLWFRRVLRPGMSGSDVLDAQRALQAHGLHDVTADGVYGPQTARAVRAWQRAHSLTQDGAIGSDTARSLR